jgi:hypothetical protein
VFVGWELAFTGVDACALHSAGEFRAPFSFAFLRCRRTILNSSSSFIFIIFVSFDGLTPNEEDPCHSRLDADRTANMLLDGGLQV